MLTKLSEQQKKRDLRRITIRNIVVFALLIGANIMVNASDTVKVSIKELSAAIEQNNRQIEFLQIQNQTYQGLIRYQQTQDSLKKSADKEQPKSAKPSKK